MNRAVRPLAVSLLLSLVLWNLPYGGFVLYPFKLLATWMHEFSHGVVMLVTGAELDHMTIFRDTSGLAYAHYSMARPAAAVIAAAGYMGTPLWGAALLAMSRSPKAARIALVGLGVALVLSAILVIENEYGIYAMTAMGGIALVFGLVAPAAWRVPAVQLIGAQACVNAVLDIRVLYRPMQSVGGNTLIMSDAHAMAKHTFATAAPWAVYLWASIWLAWSLAILYLAMRTLRPREPDPSIAIAAGHAVR